MNVLNITEFKMGNFMLCAVFKNAMEEESHLNKLTVSEAFLTVTYILLVIC